MMRAMGAMDIATERSQNRSPLPFLPVLPVTCHQGKVTVVVAC